MGLIILISSFGISSIILGPIATNYTIYKGFVPDWYMLYGNKVCNMIFMSSFIVNSKDTALFLLTMFFRCRDRKWKLNLKLDPDDEGCDLPNTRKRI